MVGPGGRDHSPPVATPDGRLFSLLPSPHQALLRLAKALDSPLGMGREKAFLKRSRCLDSYGDVRPRNRSRSLPTNPKHWETLSFYCVQNASATSPPGSNSVLEALSLADT